MDKTTSVGLVLLVIVVGGGVGYGAYVYVNDPCHWSHSDQYCSAISGGFTPNSDGTYCPPGYPYYDSTTGQCYQQAGNGGSPEPTIYSPPSSGQSGWAVQVIGSATFTCANGSQDCQCSSSQVFSYNQVTDFGYASSPGNGYERSEVGYQTPHMGDYERLTNGYPLPAAGYGLAVVDSAAGQAVIPCVSSFWSNAPPV